MRATASQLRELCERRLEKLHRVALRIDGIEFAGQTWLVALGVEEGGRKYVLGLWQGATENAPVCNALLADRVARGRDPAQRYLFVLAGSPALRAAVAKGFGWRAEVQRCPIHKRRNGKDHLPEPGRADYDRPLRNADARTSYPDAQQARPRLGRQWCDGNPSAARSLAEGREETLTRHRLGVGPLLRRSLATTHLIESCLRTVRSVARNVKRWQGGNHVARWTAAGLLEAENKFRTGRGYRERQELAEKLNLHSTPQQQVA